MFMNGWRLFQNSKYGVLMDNLSESFNATILLQRYKPIIQMFVWIKNYLMEKFATLWEKVDGYTWHIMTKPLRRFDGEIEKSDSWTSTYSGRLTLQVTHILFTNSFVMDLEKIKILMQFLWTGGDTMQTCYVYNTYESR